MSSDSSSGRARLREIAWAREVAVGFFDGRNEYGSTEASRQKYFDAFALAAQRQKASGTRQKPD